MSLTSCLKGSKEKVNNVEKDEVKHSHSQEYKHGNFHSLIAGGAAGHPSKRQY